MPTGNIIFNYGGWYSIPISRFVFFVVQLSGALCSAKTRTKNTKNVSELKSTMWGSPGYGLFLLYADYPGLSCLSAT